MRILIRVHRSGADPHPPKGVEHPWEGTRDRRDGGRRRPISAMYGSVYVSMYGSVLTLVDGGPPLEWREVAVEGNDLRPVFAEAEKVDPNPNLNP